MQAERLGVQVLSSVKFLQQIHQDLDVLIRHADKLFADKGWKAVCPTRVFARLGNKLKPQCWLLTQLYRFYVPKTEGPTEQMIAIALFLDPPDAYQEPIGVAVSATLNSPQKPVARVLSKYRKPLRRLIDSLRGQFGTIEIEAGKTPKELNAARAHVVTVPLCDLTNEADLLKRLIMPAVAAFPQAH